jgi:hypothetical protein
MKAQPEGGTVIKAIRQLAVSVASSVIQGVALGVGLWLAFHLLGGL